MGQTAALWCSTMNPKGEDGTPLRDEDVTCSACGLITTAYAAGKWTVHLELKTLLCPTCHGEHVRNAASASDLNRSDDTLDTCRSCYRPIPESDSRCPCEVNDTHLFCDECCLRHHQDGDQSCLICSTILEPLRCEAARTRPFSKVNIIDVEETTGRAGETSNGTGGWASDYYTSKVPPPRSTRSQCVRTCDLDMACLHMEIECLLEQAQLFLPGPFAVANGTNLSRHTAISGQPVTAWIPTAKADLVRQQLRDLSGLQIEPSFFGACAPDVRTREPDEDWNSPEGLANRG